MRFEVTILGNGSASPVVGRYQTAHVLNVREQFFLVDCGEGTQERLMRAGVSPLQIRAVFVSHIHGDHVYGLLPLVSSMGFMGRKSPLPIFGPAGVGRLIDFFVNDFGQPVDFPLEFTAVDTSNGGLVYENKSMEVHSVPLRHRVPTTGYVFREKQDGVGTVPRSYAFLSDTTASGRAALLAKGVDLMYHEATFSDADRHLAARTGHSTALGAAKIALKAEAGKLIIGHFSARYKDVSVLEAEARTVFEQSYIAEQGRVFSLR